MCPTPMSSRIHNNIRDNIIVWGRWSRIFRLTFSARKQNQSENGSNDQPRRVRS